MNIFALDYNPHVAAMYHNDKHVVKMILESAQLLSSAKRRLLKQECEGLYRDAYVNHPSAVWARQSVFNYGWLYRLFHALCAEYTYRYGKKHKSSEMNFNLTEDFEWESQVWVRSTNLRKKIVDSIPQCMPDCCKQSNVVDAYRAYYNDKKIHFCKYTKRVPLLGYS